MKSAHETRASADRSIFPVEGLSVHRWLNVLLLLLCIVSWLGLMQIKRDQPRREKEAEDKLIRSIESRQPVAMSPAEPIAVSRIRADGSRTPLFPSLIGKTMDAEAWSIFERMMEFQSEITGFQMGEAVQGANQKPKPANWSPVAEVPDAFADQTISIYKTEDGSLGFGRNGFFSKSFHGPESPLAKYVINGMSNE